MGEERMKTHFNSLIKRDIKKHLSSLIASTNTETTMEVG